MKPCSLLVLALLASCATRETVDTSRDPLPSWNEGATKSSIVEFVARVTKEGGPDFVPPAQRIATFGGGDEPLQPGMILSNEPGYYKSGEYGIRIENLVLVERRELAGAEQEMMGFETLTFAPVDRNLIDATMLTDDERDWLNHYHSKVLEIVGGQLEDAAKSWLEKACAPV